MNGSGSWLPESSNPMPNSSMDVTSYGDFIDPTSAVDCTHDESFINVLWETGGYIHDPVLNRNYPYNSASNSIYNMSSILNLPHLSTEIWIKICQELNQYTLKSLRLTCKHLEFAASTQLFRYFFLSSRRKSHENLQSISLHPSHSKHVRTIIYNSGRLPDINDLIARDVGIPTLALLSAGDSLYGISNSNPGFEVYTHMIRWMNVLFSRPLDHIQYGTNTTLNDCIPKFSNLTHFHLNTDHEESKDIMLKVLDRSMHGDRAIGRYLKWLWDDRVYPQMITKYYRGEASTSFWSMLSMMAEGRESLTRIEAMGIDFETFSVHASVFAPLHDNIRFVRQVSLDFVDTFGRTDMWYDVAFSKFLGALKGVETVGIGFEGVRQQMKLCRVMDERLRMPDLKHLNLQGVESTAVHLKKVLWNHRKTLRTVSLDVVVLLSEWDPVDNEDEITDGDEDSDQAMPNSVPNSDVQPETNVPQPNINNVWDPYSVNEYKTCDDTWGDMFIWMRANMNLKDVRFDMLARGPAPVMAWIKDELNDVMKAYVIRSCDWPLNGTKELVMIKGDYDRLALDKLDQMAKDEYEREMSATWGKVFVLPCGSDSMVELKTGSLLD